MKNLRHKIPTMALASYARDLVAVVNRTAEHSQAIVDASYQPSVTRQELLGRIEPVRARVRAEVGGSKASALAMGHALRLIDWSVKEWAAKVRGQGFDPQTLLRPKARVSRRANDGSRRDARDPQAPRLGATRIRARLERYGLDLDDPKMRKQVTRFAKENARLIDDLSKDQATRVATIVDKALRNRWTREEMAAKITEATGIVRRRAKLIAADQLLTLNGQMTKALSEKAGVPRYTWITMLDDRVRDEHAHRHGDVFSWDDPPEDGHPGEPINCVPGDARISFCAPAVVAYRRWYSGELTSLITDASEPLRVTPNHPILTLRGWLPAHLVQMGDHVIQAPDQRPQFLVTNPQRGDSTAEEMFGSMAAVSVVHRSSGRASWFHGDISDQDVDIVEVDRRLKFERIASFTQNVRNHILAWASDSAATLRHAAARIVTLGEPSDGLMGGSGPALSLFLSGPRHPEVHSLAGISAADSVLAKDALNWHTADANDVSDLELARPGFIHAHDIPVRKVHAVMSAPFEGLVYNFETASGWYGAHGLVIHNCRCIAQPLVEAQPEPDENAEDELFTGLEGR